MDKYKQEQTTSSVTSSLGWRHVQILLLFSGMALAYVLRTCTSIAVIAMTNKTNANPDFPEFEWSQSERTMIEMSFFVGYIIPGVPSGYIVGFWNAHKLMAFGMFFSAALHMLGPIVAQYGVIPLMINRFFVGISQGCLLPCVHTVLSRWIPPLERARLGSFVMNGPQFGTIIAMVLSGSLAKSALGWYSIFYLFGAIGVIWSIVFFFIASDSPSNHSRIKHTEKSYINGSLGHLDKAGKDEKPKVPWMKILTSRPVWALLVVHCGFNWGLYMFFTTLPKYMGSVLGFDIQNSGILSALPYICMWILGFPISYASDWSISKGFSIAIVRKIANSIGLWVPAAAVILISVIPVSNKILIVAIFALGVGFNSGVTSGFQINHIDLSANFAGTIMSITNTIANICGVIAQRAYSTIVTDLSDVSQWNTLYLLTAGIYFFTNLVFVLFGQAHVQSWNNPSGDYKTRPGRMSVISITGEPTSLYLPEQIEDDEKVSSPC